MNQPITNQPAVTINLHRGFLSLGRQLMRSWGPRGIELWDLLLKDEIERQLQKALPAGEIPVVELFDAIQHHNVPRKKRTRRVR